MYIKVKVKAGAKKESIVEIAENRFEISIKEKAEDNRANERVIELIAARYKVSQKKIRFVSGQRSPSKLFLLQ